MPTTSQDPYDTLGVAASATDGEIRLAFRKQASFWHPDRNPDPQAPARFREAQAAYDLLSDPDLRRAHDEQRRKRALEDPADAARRMFSRYLDDIA